MPNCFFILRLRFDAYGVASFYKYKKLIMQSDELFNQVTVIDEEPVSTMIEFQIDGHTINCDIKYLHLIVSAL